MKFSLFLKKFIFSNDYAFVISEKKCCRANAVSVEYKSNLKEPLVLSRNQIIYQMVVKEQKV